MMVELIQEYADMYATIDRIASKAISVQVDFPTDDFPKEMAERLEVMARCDRYSHALSVKDHMLWTAIQEKERAIELLEEERKLSHEYAEEVAHWAELSQVLSQNVNTLKGDNEQLEKTNRELMNVLREHNIFYITS